MPVAMPPSVLSTTRLIIAIASCACPSTSGKNRLSACSICCSLVSIVSATVENPRRRKPSGPSPSSAFALNAARWFFAFSNIGVPAMMRTFFATSCSVDLRPVQLAPAACAPFANASLPRALKTASKRAACDILLNDSALLIPSDGIDDIMRNSGSCAPAIPCSIRITSAPACSKETPITGAAFMTAWVMSCSSFIDLPAPVIGPAIIPATLTKSAVSPALVMASIRNCSKSFVASPRASSNGRCIDAASVAPSWIDLSSSTEIAPKVFDVTIAPAAIPAAANAAAIFAPVSTALDARSTRPRPASFAPPPILSSALCSDSALFAAWFASAPNCWPPVILRTASIA